jgi:hypothetical protein
VWPGLDAGHVTVFPAQHEFGGVLETGADEQIKTGKAPDADVLAEPGFNFLRTSQSQFTGNAPIIQSLFVQFDVEFIAGSVSPQSQIFARICDAKSDCRLGSQTSSCPHSFHVTPEKLVSRSGKVIPCNPKGEFSSEHV